MNVIWDPRATRGKQDVANYIRRRFGDDRRDVFLLHVRETTQMLKSHPNLGPVEPLLADRPTTYRSVVIDGLSKLVYFIEDDVIYIAAFWDTRREPKNQAAQAK